MRYPLAEKQSNVQQRVLVLSFLGLKELIHTLAAFIWIKSILEWGSKNTQQLFVCLSSLLETELPSFHLLNPLSEIKGIVELNKAFVIDLRNTFFSVWQCDITGNATAGSSGQVHSCSNNKEEIKYKIITELWMCSLYQKSLQAHKCDACQCWGKKCIWSKSVLQKNKKWVNIHKRQSWYSIFPPKYNQK